jgi:hypothetical protein
MTSQPWRQRSPRLGQISPIGRPPNLGEVFEIDANLVQTATKQRCDGSSRPSRWFLRLAICATRVVQFRKRREPRLGGLMRDQRPAADF